MVAFETWMKISTSLSDNSILKYVRGLRVTEKEMLERGVISKSLSQMSATELDSALDAIFNDSGFVEKNERGKRMYSCALKQYRCYMSYCSENLNNAIEDINIINDDANLSVTEKEVLSKARVGQGKFRELLFSKYESHCIITGICTPQVLVASHVKPWAVSSNTDRISAENGLLLSATYDRLFDSGLISFKSNGEMLISRNLNSEDLERLHLQKDIKYGIKPTYELKINLEYHRDTIFVK